MLVLKIVTVCVQSGMSVIQREQTVPGLKRRPVVPAPREMPSFRMRPPMTLPTRSVSNHTNDSPKPSDEIAAGWNHLRRNAPAISKAKQVS